MSEYKGQAAISWVRVSTAEQGRGYSPEGQLKANRAWAAELGLRLVKEYCLDESASDADHRSEWNSMLAYRKSHGILNVVAWDQSRLARNPEDGPVIQRLFKDDVTIHCSQPRRSFNKHSSADELFLFDINGAVSTRESRKIAERTHLGMSIKLEHGEICWEAPIGYKNIPDPADADGKRRTVIVDEARAALVKKGYELYATGQYSLSSLTDELNRLGLTSKPGRKRPSGPVSSRCVEGFLHNRFYISEFWDKKVGAHRHHPYPTFISQELFQAVQRQLQVANRNIKGRRKDGKDFAFRKFLKCQCGYQITAYEPKPELRYYVCSQRCKHSSTYSEKTVESLLNAAVGKLYIDQKMAGRIRAQMNEASDEENADILREQRRLRSKVTERQHHLDLLYEDRLAGHITIEEYQRHRAKIQAEVADLNSRLAALTSHNVEYREQGSALLDLMKKFPSVYAAQDRAGKAAILNVILRRATLRDGEADVEFQPPFSVLFAMGESLYKGNVWGE